MKPNKLQRGFTLIELLVVISIIGLLSSVVLASVTQARLKAQGATFGENIKQLQLALQLYINDHNDTPDSVNFANNTTNILNQSNPGDLPSFNLVFQPLIDGKYISSIPKVPTDNIDFFYDTWRALNNNHTPDDHYVCGDTQFGQYTLEIFIGSDNNANTKALLAAMGLPKYGNYKNGVTTYTPDYYCVTNY